MARIPEGPEGFLNRERRVSLLLLLLLVCILSISGSALGNPVGFTVSPTIYLLFIYLLLVANLPVNLLFFSGALLILSRIRGGKLGSLQEKTSQFIWTIVLTMLIVSAVGALIDFVLVFEDHNVFHNTLLRSDLARTAAATGLIFLSVLIPSHYLIGLRVESNLAASATLALLNPVFWFFAYPLDFSLALVAAIAIIVVSGDVFVLSQLAAWHKKVNIRDAEGSPRISARVLRRVAITYFGVLGISFILAVSIWGLQGERTPPSIPSSFLTENTVTDGVELTFSAMTIETQWSDITIVLDEGVNWAVWYPRTSDLDDGTLSTAEYGSKSFGPLIVYCNVTDIGGNGWINHGDYLTLTTGGDSFSWANTYTCSIVYEPADSQICSISFAGS